MEIPPFSRRYGVFSRFTAAFGRGFARLGRRLDRLWNSSWYFPLLTAMAALFLASGEILAGLAAMLLIFSLFLAACPDLLASLYPLLLLMLLSTRYYESNAILYRYWWTALAAVLALGVRLLHHRLPARPGRFDKSLLAVSAATLLGGAGVIPAEEYFSPIGLYYSLGLGVFMLGNYRLFRSELARPRSYDTVRRFAAILYAAGLFTALLILDRYLPYWDYFLREWKVIHIPCRNYFATMLLFALPTPFYFLRENKGHLLGILLLYAAALLTGSRSALILGSALLLISTLWYCYRSILSRKAFLTLAVVLSLISAALVLLAAKTLFLSREIDGLLFSKEDSRITFLRLALQDFWAHPLTGQGLANMQHSSVFLGVRGSIVWYHNYLAQIIGSMGLVGLAAYTWQMRERLRLLRELRGSRAEVLTLAYLGMLLISLTNPGEFSPFPAEFLVIVLFTVAENAAEQAK